MLIFVSAAVLAPIASLNAARACENLAPGNLARSTSSLHP